MNKYFLTFIDPNVEAHYQASSQEGPRKFQLTIFMEAYFVIFASRCIMSLLKEQNEKLYLNLSMLAVVILTGVFVRMTHISFRFVSVINNHILTIFFLVYDDISDPVAALLKGVNMMGSNFLMVMTNEFPESVLQIFTITIIRIIHFSLKSISQDYTPVISLIICSIFWIYYLYNHHKAMRSQFLLTMIDSQWEQIFKQLLNQKSYTLLHFDEENLQFHQYLTNISNNLKQQFHSQEQIMLFLSEAKYQSLPLKDYIYRQLQQFNKKRLNEFNIQLQVQFQRSLLILSLSIFVGNKPTILIVFPNQQEQTVIQQKNENFSLKFLAKVLKKLKNKFQLQPSDLKFARKIQIIQFLQHLEQRNIMAEKIDIANWISEVSSYYPSLRVEIFSTIQHETVTIKECLQLFCYCVLQCSNSEVIKIYIYHDVQQLKAKFIGSFKYVKIQQVVNIYSYHFYRIFQYISIYEKGIHFFLLEIQIWFYDEALLPFKFPVG